MTIFLISVSLVDMQGDVLMRKSQYTQLPMNDTEHHVSLLGACALSQFSYQQLNVCTLPH